MQTRRCPSTVAGLSHYSRQATYACTAHRSNSVGSTRWTLRGAAEKCRQASGRLLLMALRALLGMWAVARGDLRLRHLWAAGCTRVYRAYMLRVHVSTRAVVHDAPTKLTASKRMPLHSESKMNASCGSRKVPPRMQVPCRSPESCQSGAASGGGTSVQTASLFGEPEMSFSGLTGRTGRSSRMSPAVAKGLPGGMVCPVGMTTPAPRHLSQMASHKVCKVMSLGATCRHCGVDGWKWLCMPYATRCDPTVQCSAASAAAVVRTLSYIRPNAVPTIRAKHVSYLAVHEALRRACSRYYLTITSSIPSETGAVHAAGVHMHTYIRLEQAVPVPTKARKCSNVTTKASLNPFRWCACRTCKWKAEVLSSVQLRGIRALWAGVRTQYKH